MYTAVQKKMLKKYIWILAFSKDVFNRQKRGSKGILLENISILNMLCFLTFYSKIPENQ